MKIEIVIPVINLWKNYTKPAIDSVLTAMMRAKTHGIDCHIILLDNKSTDETQEQAPKMDANLLYYQRNEERWGFQKSVNRGANYGFEHEANAAFVLNNDILMHPEAIWRLADRLSKGDVGMVTCMDVSHEMKEKGMPAQDIANLNPKDKEATEDAPHPCFSAFMISRECWDAIGEFDEGFAPAYFEDNDYHYRMKLAGIEAIVHPPAMFYHYASRTNLEANESGTPMISNSMFEHSRTYYVAKWGGMPSPHNTEKYSHPFNNEALDIKATKQNTNN